MSIKTAIYKLKTNNLFNLGRVELWDLTKNNMLDPLAFDKPALGEKYASKTMINFCPGSPIITTGDVAGDINVYRLHGINFLISGYEDQV
jgi:hypothetical protein